jgi:hypothetical protein
MREGQDWWLRDQNQLAFGFDNWNHGVEDMAGWFTAQGGVVGSPTLVNPGVNLGVNPGVNAGPGAEAALPSPESMNGGPVMTNGHAIGAANGGMVNGDLAGALGGFGAGLNAYNEQEWYQ